MDSCSGNSARMVCSQNIKFTCRKILISIPVPGATLPVIACCMIAIYGRNPLLFMAAVILGVGHIGIHLNHRKDIFI